MKKVQLGLTEIAVSRLGLGTVKFGRNQGVHYPESFILPTDSEIEDLLSYAYDLGINLLDTAPAYGTSEERLGKILKNQRQRWVISTKVGEEFSNGTSTFDFSPNVIQKSIERSLQRLQADVLDIVLVHSSGEDEKIITQDNVFEILSKLKEKGLIRAYGMSVKTEQGGKLTVDHADVVMVTYNPIHTEEKSVIDYAHQNHKGIFIKKALASGHINKIPGEDPIQTAMQFIFQEPGVTSVILGTLNKTHLAQVVTACDNLQRLSS